MRAEFLVTEKKTKVKTMRELYFTYMPGCPQWGDRFEF